MPLVLPRLRALREERGLTATALAQRAGISRATVRRVEAGHPARRTTAVLLAHALGTEWRALVGDHPAPIREGALHLDDDLDTLRT